MNCHELLAVAGELVRDQLMDATQREKALEHTASCVKCSNHLADERALTAAFQTLSRVADEQAPPRVEAAVLAAFREKHASVPAIAPQRQSRRWLYAVAAAAAVMIIVGMLAVLATRNSHLKDENASNKSPEIKPERLTPIPFVTPTPPSTVEPAPSPVVNNKPKGVKKNKLAPQPSLASSNPDNKPTEIATDFIPLMVGAVEQMDGGQVMRVELPRSALMSFGLPMDMERATERVKADVVVGNDGLARAIRFVR
jgi:cytochrome c-type biogenesis protein CcmH/NrfF